MIGQVLGGRYEINKIIGQGGFGTVYRARQTSIEREVAIKVLSLDASQDENLVKRFESEAKIISQLRHPNTLKLFDFGRTEDERLFLVLELLDGAPLDRVLRDGPMAPRRVLSLMKQACGSLEEAHERGIIHRDLKPGNIFAEKVGRREVAKVLDFGIAKVVTEQSHTMTGQMFGTPLYMSPEQVQGKTVDPRSDIYSLGVLMFECFAGRTPFEGGSPYSVLMKHVSEEPPPLREVNPQLQHPVLDAFIAKLMAKDPKNRPADAGEVIDLIEEVDATLVQAGEPARSSVDFEPNMDVFAETMAGVPSEELEAQAATSDQGSKPLNQTGSAEIWASAVETGINETVQAPRRSLGAIIGGGAVLAAAVVGFLVLGGETQEIVAPSPQNGSVTTSKGTEKVQAAAATHAKPATEKKPVNPSVLKNTSAKAAADATAGPEGPAKEGGETKKTAANEPKEPKEPSDGTSGVAMAKTPKAATVKAKPKAKLASKAKRRTLPKGKSKTVAAKRSAKKKGQAAPKAPVLGVASVRVQLRPARATYSLNDRPRAVISGKGLDGAPLGPASLAKVEWSIIGAKPLGAATVDSKGKLSFKKEVKGRLKGCIQGKCDEVKFLSFDESSDW